ncbi:MAG TPA: heme o synthase [Gemmatimonadales bacterium]|nr:heme o synthase [Gemmatimonadales bacterium]
MKDQTQDRTRLLRRLAWTGTALAFGLIVLGGVVRITGSGMGCGEHWPRCNGEWFPPLDLPTAIEISHRWVAALVSLLVVGVTAVAWARHRTERSLLVPATLATVLLVVQVLLGAVTVKLALPPWVIITHLGNAMLLLATLLVTAVRARPGGLPPKPARRHPAHGLVHAVAALGFVVILYGAQVANFHAGWVCRGFPLCTGAGLLPPDTPLGGVHWLHRVLAYSFLALVVGLVVRVARYPGARRGAAALRHAAWWVLGVTLAQVAVAAAMVLQTLPPSLRALHLLVGTAVWVALVWLVLVSSRTSAEAAAGEDEGETGGATTDGRPHPAKHPHHPKEPSLAADLVTLTKPRIISLLLVTTIAPMFITDRGLPPLSLVLWVTLGGYLMAGGANAINMWFDRDIDTKMTRTRLRPIASGRISAPAGLAFGLTLGAVAFAIFWRFVNPLSAWLALGGLLFYVLIYTMWLKRTTTQNIVIGGAAGAFPPLVGWAAVTGRLDLAAIYLFAIIFYWTPPHFWALALIKQGEYAKAGVPMMPVVRGERRTKVEMLVYTLILLPLTVLPVAFRALSPLYGIAAALLGARLLWYCVRLLREQGVTPTAWKMYKYSLLYLALLFVAMGVDRALPLERTPRAQDIVRLRDPGEPFPLPAAIAAPAGMDVAAPAADAHGTAAHETAAHEAASHSPR